MKQLIVVVAKIVGLQSILWLFQTFEASGQNRPNIIFLLADDMRSDAVNFAGNSIIKTPNIDKLADDGIVFKNAYVTTSICSASRASILTGQYSRKHGVRGFSENITGEALLNTYPLQLKQNGYNIGFIGKYGIGNEMPDEYFDYWKGFGGQGTYFQEDSAGNDVHLTHKISGQISEFIKKFGNSSKPFCLSVSFKAPHVEGDHLDNPFPYDEKFSHLYKNDSIALPGTYNDFETKFPEGFKNQNEARIRFHSRFAHSEKYQESVRSYYRLIAGIDETIKNLRKQLKASGLENNTVIIFTSDNGFYLGEHGMAGKWYGHEVSIRVPLVIYNPLQEQAKPTINNIALNIDMAPTILNFAGIQPPEQMQGCSLKKLMDETTSSWREDFFYEHLFFVEPNPGWWVYIPQTEGIVTDTHKYMRYFYNNKPDEPIHTEVYNTKSDPEETENLAESFLQTPEGKSLLKRFEQVKEEAR